MAQKKQIESIRHDDKRTNNPTEELRDFVSDDEKEPKSILYSRDPSLDPQLVWKGKYEQDSQDLEVESVPIYIQEKIQPRAIIEDLRATAKEESQQPDLFDDFNGIEFEDLIDFYQHDQNWTNRMILGDSLLVMNSLAEKEGLKGQVQMIYIDPPYGIKFGSNWQVSTRKREVKDGSVDDLTRQPEQIKAFRDTWELGIHSYLSYLRDRLAVARELLTESGSIFVQIGDENVHLVRCLMDEVFGSENFRSVISFKTTSAQTTEDISNVCDYIIWYFKDISQAKKRKILIERNKELLDRQFDYVEDQDGCLLKVTQFQKRDTDFNKYRRVKLDSLTSQHESKTRSGPFKFRGDTYHPHTGRQWGTSEEGMNRLVKLNRIYPKGENIFWKRYADEFGYVPMDNMWNDTTATGTRKSAGDEKIYIVQTMTKVIARCLLMTTDPGDLVLDPTCGSGTTAYVAESWGRRWITVDTSRVALSLARTRLIAGKYPYYLLADSSEGVMKEAVLTNEPNRAVNAETSGDIKKGFVHKRVPHITLKSIANNPDVDDTHAKWQEQLEPLRAEINNLAGKSWKEWEIPPLESANHPCLDESAKYQAAIEQWWELYRERQDEIDAAINRHSEGEILYDKPFVDSKRLRVTGPFTAESLSPHRVLSSDPERNDGMSQPDSQSFETRIIENLKKAGVQNTVKEERLKFDWIEPYAGEWIQAEGRYTENGEEKRAAVSIGPEYGTVSRDQIKEAAKEAVRGVDFHLLIVCGFAFDPHASEEQTRYGKLKVLTPHINPDLMMGDELLKKTGTGNLFMVFGEPDVDIKIQQDEKVVVELKGVDVYDPTMGRLRSESTDGIACWFIDTNYNGESFFVRHAYFTGKTPSGTKKPYEDLKKALKAEIDEEAWESLYDTKSRPFAPPETGKIAVKVINHYGDEVLKVYDIKN